MMSSPPDDGLMLEVQNGDLRKLGVLFERHRSPLFNFYLRMTGNRAVSEDLVQDVFFRILRSRHTYKAGSSFVTWMYHIARKAGIDQFRKSGREIGMESEDRHAARQPLATEVLEAEQEAELVRRALDKLPEDRRELLLLSRFQNLKCNEIGELLGCQAGTVRVRIFRALRELRQIYFELRGGAAAVG
jgi:RNA polymerase sigma factor (sigma-70 family)